jgi:hypothetical protein
VQEFTKNQGGKDGACDPNHGQILS